MIPTSWGSVFAACGVVIFWFGVVCVCINVFGRINPISRHRVPTVAGKELCWMAPGYIWPFGPERLLCVPAQAVER